MTPVSSSVKLAVAGAEFREEAWPGHPVDVDGVAGSVVVVDYVVVDVGVY